MSADFSLSIELVNLLNWLLKNKKEDIRKLVDEAVDAGCVIRESSVEPTDYESLAPYVNKTVAGFVNFLEDSLMEHVEEDDNIGEHFQERLESSIENLDLTGIDPESVWMSVQQTKSSLVSKAKSGVVEEDKLLTEKIMREALFKTILKNWHPDGNEVKS